MPAPWTHPVLLAREGAIVPLNLAEQHFAKPRHEPGFALFPPRVSGTAAAEFFVDDGESEAYRAGGRGAWQLQLGADAQGLTIHIERAGQQPPQDTAVTLLLPKTELRPVRILGGQLHSDALSAVPPASYRALRVELPRHLT
jgi:alpha-glucosidase